jgi:nitrogen regulatory protein P-II 1
MAHLLVFVLDNIEQCSDVMDAWDSAGVTGVTILESTGLARMRRELRDDFPLIPSLRSLLAGREMHHRTLFSVIRDDAILDRAIAATQEVVGDLSQPYSGLLFVVPVSQVVGLKGRNHAQDR